MAIELIPLISDGAQELTVVLDGVVYDLFVSYNERMGYWTLSIASNGATLVSGAALVGGVDIVEQFTFELKNLWAINLTDSDADAGADNLGTDVQFLKVDEATIEQVSSGA